MSFIESIALSILASVAGTYLLRRFFSAQGSPGAGASARHVPYSAVVVVVPIVVGNSGNHLFHLQGRRGLFH